MPKYPTTVIPDIIITHGGVFHADDVFACAFIKLCAEKCGFDGPTIYRVKNDKELQEQLASADKYGVNAMVVDIGGGKFDHHTPESKRYRLMGTPGRDLQFRQPYASFGLVVNEFWEVLMTDREMHIFDSQMCVPIDMQDECGSLQYGVGNMLSEAIRLYNPTWAEQNETEDDIDILRDQAFEEVMHVAICFIERYIANAKAIAASENVVDAAYDEAAQKERHWIELPYYVNWQGRLARVSKDEIDWCLYPSARGGFQIYCALHDGKQRLLTEEMYNALM